jgi:cell division initiation protein
MSDACIKEAKEKSARIIREAEIKAQGLVADANRMTAVEKENYLALQADAVNLRNELIDLYSSHIKAIDDFPTSADVEASKEELDKKYPTTPVERPRKVEQPVEAPERPVAPTQAEAVSVPVQKEEAPVVVSSDTTRVPIKKTSKFSHLKFGDNYDVSDE